LIIFITSPPNPVSIKIKPPVFKRQGAYGGGKMGFTGSHVSVKEFAIFWVLRWKPLREFYFINM
jgi:hypothetical protein